MDFPLVAEPDGGTELEQTQMSVDGARMKEMGPVETGDAYHFWMSAQAEADLVSSIRTQVLKDASKKANFPGFRKGQIPPYAQPQITLFAIQESIIKTVESVIAAYGLESLSGSAGQVEVLEDVKEMAKCYKKGDTVPFTAKIDCSYAADTARAGEVGEEDVIDVQVDTTE